jgi:DNA-binding XRE family transcriptional regulator
MDFVNRINQLVKVETVGKLAERLGVSRQTIYNWSKGNHLPPLELIERMGGVVTFPNTTFATKAQEIAATVSGVTTAAALPERHVVRDEHIQDW